MLPEWSVHTGLCLNPRGEAADATGSPRRPQELTPRDPFHKVAKTRDRREDFFISQEMISQVMQTACYIMDFNSAFSSFACVPFFSSFCFKDKFIAHWLISNARVFK